MAPGASQIQSSKRSEPPPADRLAVRAVIVIGSTRATPRELIPPGSRGPHSNARATNPAPSLSGSNRAGAGRFPTVLASPETYRPGMARNRKRANASGSQILVVSSLALDEPFQQQAHPKGSLVRGGLQQSSGAIRLTCSRLLASHSANNVAEGLNEAVLCRHQIHRSGLQQATPVSKAVTP